VAYLLDANVFIQAKRLHYGMDFCPSFWDWLREQNEAGRVFSIEKVADELTAGDDQLSRWAEQRGDAFLSTARRGYVDRACASGGVGAPAELYSRGRQHLSAGC